MDWCAICGCTVFLKIIFRHKVSLMDLFLMILKLRQVCLNGWFLVLLLFTCYILPLEEKRKELGMNYHFYADDTVLYVVFGTTLSQCLFDDILTSIQHWFSNEKLKLNADKSGNTIFREGKIVKHGHLLLPEDGEYTKQVKFLVCYIDCQLTLQRQVNFDCSISFWYLRKVW